MRRILSILAIGALLAVGLVSPVSAADCRGVNHFTGNSGHQHDANVCTK